MADLTDKPKDQEEVDLVGLEQLKQESPDVLSEPAFPIVTNLPESQPTAEVVDFPIVTDFPKASPFSDGGLRFSADRAKGVDPVQHAEDVELSRQTGLPVETVSKNRGAIFERMSAPDLDKIEKDSPVLSRGLSNPDFAIFSKKSLPALEAIEKRYKAQKERTFTQVTLDDLKRGTARLGATGEALGYQLDNLISKMGQGFLPKPRHISEEDWEKQRLRSIPVGGLLKAREAEEAIPQNPKIEEFTQIVESTQQEKGTASAVWEATKYLATNPTLFVGLLAEQAAPMAATLPLGGPVIGSAVNPVVSRIANEALRKYVATSVKLSAIQGSSVMVQMYGSEINEGLSKGLSVEDALDRAAKKTMVEAGVNMLAGPIPGAGKNPVLLALQETAKQGVLGATGAAAGSAAVGEQISLSEFLLEGFGELTTAPIDWGVASFEMTSSGRQDARRGVDLGPDIVPLEVEEAFESIHAQTELTEMIAMVQSADVTSLSPASMKEYIDELANEYEHNNVLYIDADNPEVADVLNAMEDSPIFGELKKQFAEGGDIVIPLSDYLTEVAISDYGNNLRNHVRITEDGLTLAELQDFSEDTEKKIENILTRVVKSIDDVVLEEEDQAKLDAFKESVFTSLIATERMDQRIAKANTEVLASRIPTIMADYSLSFDEAVERLGFGGVVASEPPKSGEVVTMAQEQGYEGADPVEASEWSQAIAKFGPEGMTREARLARAEEMGYDTSQVYYHGTDVDFASFDPSINNTEYSLGTHLTTRPEEAGRYAAPWPPAGDKYKEGGHLKPLLVRSNNVLRIETDFPAASMEADLNRGVIVKQLVTAMRRGEEYDAVEISTTQKDEYQHKNIIIFDPSNIRSINAAFDPDFAASPNLLAQEAGEERNLFIAHNLSAENIIAAADLGGLAAPSVAVGKTDAGFESFGEVTLLADPAFLDDTKVRTFDADVYSPRFPRPIYDVNEGKYTAFMKGVDEDSYNLSRPSIQELSETTGAEIFAQSEGVQYYWLKEQGKAPKIKKQKLTPLLRKLVNIDQSSPEFVEAIENDIAKTAETLSAEARADYLDSLLDKDGNVRRSFVREKERSVDYYKRNDGNDVRQLSHDITKKMRVEKTRKEYDAWAVDAFNSMIDGKKIFKGFTPSGNRRYVDFNMSNILKEMTQQIRAGEGFFYGAGTIRSAYAKELKTLKAIQSRRDDIISDEEFQTIKDEAQNVLITALDDLKPFYKYQADSFGYYDDAGSAIAEGAKGQREAFDLEPEAKKIIDDLVQYLVNLPTTYFEAKVGRAVSFDEFNTAVVPKGIRADALKILKDAGLKIKKYDPKTEGDRQRVVSEQNDLLFQSQKKIQAFFLPEKRVIGLTKHSNPSSFVHEVGHLFLEVEKELAEEFGTTPR
ncbi:MAG TPA: hypothetical protein DCZ12_15890, partial [Gammaproteobacteria bacterium]|nr:hypothetical protein [Gammaproteobacteria bacterium]